MKFFRNFKKVYKYSYGYRRYIIFYFILTIITSLVGIVSPLLLASLLVNLTNEVWNLVIIYTIFIFIVNVLGSFFSFVSQFLTEKFSRFVVSRIQLELGREILSLQLSDIDKHSNGVFIQRLTGDTSSICSIFTFGVSSFTGIISKFGIFIIVFAINKWIGLFFLIFMVIFFILQRVKNKKINDKDINYRDQRERTSGFTTEVIRGIRDIKMLNAENTFMKSVEESVLDLNEKRYSISSVRRWFWLLNDFIHEVFSMLLIFLIVFFTKNGIFDVAVGIVIYNYRNSISSVVLSITYIFDYLRDFNLSCDRVFSLFGSKEFSKEKFGNKHLDKIEGNFAFHDVTFGYDDHHIVLDKINFEVHANETVAFVGKSGAGKSTIFNLLCKLYDVSSGSITIDGIDIKSLDKDSIRGNISIISQNPYIFNMSIRDNLRLVKDDLTDEEMISACKMACLDDFIDSLSDGYDTIVGEGGVMLSGGQRQRLAIARAMVQKTEIILFDEATSALDNETQARIQKAIDNMKREYTILIIAHRLSTIVGADRILFIEDGKVVDSGSHKELLLRNSSYKKLYESEIDSTS